MPKTLKLLLTENVDSLGIVGDVVNVRTGYARNFLMPRNLATTPSDEKVKELAAKRADAERQLAHLRKQREELIEKIKGIEVTLQRSCNDQGILYGAITQQDVATALNEMGHGVKPRDVRLAQTIKRIDAYDIHVKLDSDLDASVKLWVVADRELDLDKEQPAAAASTQAAPQQQDLLAADDAAKKASKGGWGAPKAAAEGDAGDKKKHDKHEKADKHDKHEKSDKAPKAEKSDKPKKGKDEGKKGKKEKA